MIVNTTKRILTMRCAGRASIASEMAVFATTVVGLSVMMRLPTSVDIPGEGSPVNL